MKGKKSRKEAAKDTAKNVGKAGIAGGIVMVGVTTAATLGAASILANVAPVIGVAGAGVYGISAFQRIKHALQEPNSANTLNEDAELLSFDTLTLYFHERCQDCESDRSCYEQFAAEVSTYPEVST